MTDNEKAATFIGWKPGQVCGRNNAAICAECYESMDRQAGDSGCYDHPLLAPDMSDPRNYMKALEEVSARGSQAWDFLNFEFHYNNVPKTWEFSVIDESAQSRLLWQTEGPALSEVVVKALAALYDAEAAK